MKKFYAAVLISVMAGMAVPATGMAANANSGKALSRNNDMIIIAADSTCTGDKDKDATKDKTLDKLKDGSGISAIQIGNTVMSLVSVDGCTGDQDQVRDKDGDGDGDGSKGQTRDGSCLPAIEMDNSVITLAGNGNGRGRGDCDGTGGGSPDGSTSDSSGDQDQLRDGSCLPVIEVDNGVITLAGNGNGRGRGDCDGTGGGSPDGSTSDSSGDQDQLRDGSCLPAIENNSVNTIAGNGDEIKDQQHDKSCLPG